MFVVWIVSVYDNSSLIAVNVRKYSGVVGSQQFIICLWSHSSDQWSHATTADSSDRWSHATTTDSSDQWSHATAADSSDQWSHATAADSSDQWSHATAAVIRAVSCSCVWSLIRAVSCSCVWPLIRAVSCSCLSVHCGRWTMHVDYFVRQWDVHVQLTSKTLRPLLPQKYPTLIAAATWRKRLPLVVGCWAIHTLGGIQHWNKVLPSPTR